MPKAMWKGAISFSLVSVPVALYKATEEHDLSFRQVRKSDGSPIKYRRFAQADNAEVAFEDIGKGYELPDGQMVVLTDDDLASLPLSTVREISVEQFVPLGEVDVQRLSGAEYYVAPQSVGVRPFTLLHDALAESERGAVVKVALRGRERLALLRPADGVMLLDILRWPDEIRDPHELLPQPVMVSDAERDMARQLVDALTVERMDDLSQTEDAYAIAVRELVEAKAAGTVTVPQQPAKPQEQPSMADQLAASIKAARAAKAGRVKSGGTTKAKPSDMPGKRKAKAAS